MSPLLILLRMPASAWKGPRLRMTPASAKYWSTSGPSDAPVKTSTWKSSFSLSLQVQEVQPLHRQHV